MWLSHVERLDRDRMMKIILSRKKDSEKENSDHVKDTSQKCEKDLRK